MTLAVTELYSAVSEQYDRHERADRARWEKWLMSCALGLIADEAARAADLVGDEARCYAQGFAGVHAKIANPRALGLESVFRAGRQARQAKGGEQTIRARAAQLRSEPGYSFIEWVRNVAYPVSPAPWERSFRG